jgi:hypothetical protein
LTTSDFTTAPADGEEAPKRDKHPFTLDGRRFVATMPKLAVWTAYFAGFAPSASAAEAARSVTMYLDAALTPEDAAYLETRWRDPDDRLDLPHLIDITRYLVAHWSELAEQEFRAMGLSFEAAAANGAANRATRRAEQQAARDKPAGVKRGTRKTAASG